MMYGFEGYWRHSAGGGGNSGDRQKRPHRMQNGLPHPIYKFKSETPEQFHAFRVLAEALWKKDFAESERTLAKAITSVMAATPPNKPATPDVLPHKARGEQAARHRKKLTEAGTMAAIAVLDKLEIASAEKERTAKVRRIGKYVIGTVAIAAGISSVLLLGRHLEQQNQDHQESVTLAVKDQANLSKLGICATDMRMELAYDLKSKASATEIAMDRAALFTAENAPTLKCTTTPPKADTLYYLADYSGQLNEIDVERSEITEFVSAAWPVQKQHLNYEMRHLGEDEEPDIYRTQITAGDSVYNTEKQ
jgi:hypothetical protein